MNDPHHTWNDGDPIRSEKQQCGCEISEQVFTLCRIGKDCKKAVDHSYSLWQAQKDTPIDASIIRAHKGNYELNKRCYLKHLATGDYWVL